MKPSLVLKEMKELREAWRKQGFTYTNEQQIAYNKLLELRRKRVKSFYKDNRVWKGSSTAGKTTPQDK
tara:strand:- start:635 stop:838 length:204 start_codon:yes stop_codon:yes gene_type:complete